jgi:sec-independent protein translocase protein TatA
MFGLWNISGAEVFVLCILGVLLFGNKLPSVGRNLAQTLRTFRNSYHGIEDEIQEAVRTEPARAQLTPPQRIGVAVPKFEENGTAI